MSSSHQSINRPPAETQDCIAAFSPEYVEGLLAVKRAEWQRFVMSTTDWELDEYLEYD